MSQVGKILVVEDSHSQAAVIAEVVRQAGYAPVVYHELPRGVVKVLEAECPIVVLLDLRLLDAKGRAVSDGFQICREIKRSPYKVPVVVITAEDDEDAFEWATLQGADAYVQKPFAAADLTEVLNRVLGSSKVHGS